MIGEVSEDSLAGVLEQLQNDAEEPGDPPPGWRSGVEYAVAAVYGWLNRQEQPGVSSQQDDERTERERLADWLGARAMEWRQSMNHRDADEAKRAASLLRSSAQPSQPVPDPVHDEAADAPSGPLEWRRIADNVFRFSRWLDSIGRADWGHELRRASGELSRAHEEPAQPSQMDVDALEETLVRLLHDFYVTHDRSWAGVHETARKILHLFSGAPQDVEK